MAWMTAACGFVVLLQAVTPVDKMEGDRRLAAEATQDFLEAIASADAKTLVDLGTVPFTFEGRVLKDRESIHRFWKQHLKKQDQILTRQQDAQVEIIDYSTAREKFGPPPKKFSHLRLKKCQFAAVTFPRRNGYLLILTHKKKKGWRVTGVTD